MTKPLTVEQLVRKSFCPNPLQPNTFAFSLYNLVLGKWDALYLASAARRFVRMENEQKLKREHAEYDRLVYKAEADLRITTCRKTTGKGI